MIVQRYDTALYVRSSWFRGNLDKVVRLRVGAGPIDFIQDDISISYRHVLRGIVNGIDTEIWNPETDPIIPARYSTRRLNARAINPVIPASRASSRGDSPAVSAYRRSPRAPVIS